MSEKLRDYSAGVGAEQRLTARVAELEAETAELRAWRDQAVGNCAKWRCATRDRDRKEIEAERDRLRATLDAVQAKLAEYLKRLMQGRTLPNRWVGEINDLVVAAKLNLTKEALAQQPTETPAAQPGLRELNEPAAQTARELPALIDPYVECRDMQVRLQRLIEANGPLRAVAKAALALSRSSRSMADPRYEVISEARLTALESALEAAGYGMTEEEVARAIDAPPPADVSRGT